MADKSLRASSASGKFLSKRSMQTAPFESTATPSQPHVPVLESLAEHITGSSHNTENSVGSVVSWQATCSNAQEEPAWGLTVVTCGSTFATSGVQGAHHSFSFASLAIRVSISLCASCYVSRLRILLGPHAVIFCRQAFSKSHLAENTSGVD